MRALTAAQLLAAWEQAHHRPPAARALVLLAAAWPETAPETLARLSVGQCDARLAALREQTFGPTMAGLAACPACGQRLELSFNLDDVRVAPPAAAPPEVLTVDHDGCRVRFRLPTIHDLDALSAEGAEPVQARERLLARCLLAVEINPPQAGAPLPAAVVEAVAARMAEADPQADVRLALTCPACRHAWEALFDIAAYFWQELDAWARRLLSQVHRLALAYGWDESAILALSPFRRQAYLEMIAG
jgi:hypothetical protein